MQKLLKNLTIHAITSLDTLQMEVFASNSDTFLKLVSSSIAYICSSKQVQFDLCSLLVNLIEKTTGLAIKFGLYLEKGLEEFIANLIELIKISTRDNQF